jgi:LemA protein
VTAAVSAVAVLAALLAIGAAVSYNRFVRQRNLVAESWRQIDVELVRRHHLVPDLVRAVQAHAAHERGVLEAVTAARSRAEAPSATVGEQAAGEAHLTDGLRRLVALGEDYPALRADRHFHTLQLQLVETEDRIAAARRVYNGNVRALNTRIEAVPSAWVASLGGFGRAEYFLADEGEVRSLPMVHLGA